MLKTPHSAALITVIFLFLYLNLPQINSLRCLCDHCYTLDKPEIDSCEVSNNTESYCFKSVKRRREDNGTLSTETTYGCLTSNGGTSLGHLQCFVNTRKHVEATYIKCCRNEDYCNENITDPDGKDDPRWNETDTIDISGDDSLYGLVLKFIYYNSTLTIISYFLSCSLILAIILGCLSSIISKCNLKSSRESSGSLCSIKVDLEKVHAHFQHHHINTSSSTSTQSYSISDYMCHKSPPTIRTNNDESYIPQDLTSGLGERMFNQRTIARIVGFGKTDHVGNGRFGRVFRGEFHGDDVAVKAFKTIDQDSWRREDNILRILNHENIVRFISSETTSLENGTTEIWMFLEFCPYGSLCDYLDHHEIIGPKQAVTILYSIINGLNYLHEDYAQASRLYKPSIAHRDIKSKNILMRTPDSCCIADFGHALIKLDEETLDYGKYQHLQVGTIRYMAPEILRPNERLNYRQFSTFAQADLYQYGLILWEVSQRTALDILHPAGNHKLPYDGVVPQNPSLQDMIKIVCEDRYRPPRYDKWDKYPIMNQLADLMIECWRHKPDARMETLGVKKRLKELLDDATPPLNQQYNLSVYINNSLSSNAKGSDVTL